MHPRLVWSQTCWTIEPHTHTLQMLTKPSYIHLSALSGLWINIGLSMDAKNIYLSIYLSIPLETSIRFGMTDQTSGILCRMYVCMDVYICICRVHLWVNLVILLNKYTYICTHADAYMYVYTYTNRCICMH